MRTPGVVTFDEQLWSRSLSGITGGPQAAVAAGEAAVALLPLLTWRGVSRTDQLQLLQSHAGSLASDGAAAAVASGAGTRAVELLEQGRAVLWSQLLDTRTDLDRLTAANADLASRLSKCRHELERELDAQPEETSSLLPRMRKSRPTDRQVAG